MDTSEFTSRAAIKVPMTYNKKDLILYSLGIGCNENQFVYEFDEKFAAFPTYPIVLAFKGDEGADVLPFPPPVMQLPELSASLPGVRAPLDFEKVIEKVCDLPTDPVPLVSDTKLVGIAQKAKGAIVENEYVLKDANTGKVYYKMLSSAYMTGVKGVKDSGVVSSKDIPVPTSAPDKVLELKTDARASQIYRLSGDYNPLHIDPNMSAMMGFKEPIIHGLCSLGHAARALLQMWCDNDPAKYKSLRLRFSSPVLPGQTLVVESWKTGPTSVLFQVKVKETGKVCISNAAFEMEPSAKL
eukprot:TRINITY_DN121960_c0_g1_i1.p1 TRINITY_DN121960_c0_g1~~TRINITY_DN121960_c0_g1_i1.p1  ORF type:complete len:298 (-),score=78.96 TRINITY_DN121960_c0_g1_i1:189-1082(-)